MISHARPAAHPIAASRRQRRGIFTLKRQDIYGKARSNQTAWRNHRGAWQRQVPRRVGERHDHHLHAQGQDAPTPYHSHPRRPCGGGTLPLRPYQRPNYLPQKITHYGNIKDFIKTSGECRGIRTMEREPFGSKGCETCWARNWNGTSTSTNTPLARTGRCSPIGSKYFTFHYSLFTKILNK